MILVIRLKNDAALLRAQKQLMRTVGVGVEMNDRGILDSSLQQTIRNELHKN